MPAATIDLQRIGDTVRVLRAERGWLQQQLAEKADVSRRTVRAIEGAEYRAYDSTYGRIAQALGVPLSELMGEGAA